MKRILALFGAIAAVACGSSTAPTPKLVIAITGASSYQGHDTTINSQAQYICYTQMIASASGGEPGQVATWGSGHYTFVLAATGRTSSSTFPSATYYFLGGPTLAAGTQTSGGSTPYWSGPFSLSETFYYSTPEQHIDSARYSFACR